MNIFVTADLHLGHTNIIKHCNRPFKNCFEMNETICNNWNNVVRSKDLVYIIGDFAWKDPRRYINKLNGRKILIRGNHDRKSKVIDSLFEEVHDILVRNINKQKVVFCHYRMLSWPGSNRGSYLLYGHSHGTLIENPEIPCCDVGVDIWDFTPINWDILELKLKNRAKMGLGIDPAKLEQIRCENLQNNRKIRCKFRESR